MKRLISIVIPAYNEWNWIKQIYSDILKTINQIQNYNFEIIFVNDWSKDNTWEEINELHSIDKNVIWINFARNFWKEIALSAGLEYASWNAVITLDCDWQHPVEKIPLFIEEWENWIDIVYNKRPEIEKVNFLKKLSSKLFYKIFNTISNFKMESWTTDYRLLDRKVVDMFLKLKEKNRTYRWLVDWLWFNKKALIFNALPNKIWREPSYSFVKLVKLAIDSITSFSVFPLKLVWFFWVIVTFLWFFWLFLSILDKINILNIWFSNLFIIVIINTILMWIILISLWFISLYIATIHKEVLNRPLYIVKEVLKNEKVVINNTLL